MPLLPTNHVDAVETITAAIINDMAAQINTNTNAIAALGGGGGGGTAQTYVVKTANYTVLTTDASTYFDVDASAGAVTITLPSASAAGAGFEITVGRINAGANAVTVVPAGSDTIIGQSSYPLNSQWTTVTLVSTGGTAWRVK
jgi:hypothetical protein